jgi:multidrug efflux pump subunit AcrA (membrane-fusion protein)
MRDQADLPMRAARWRSQELLQRNFISRSAVDTAQAKVDGFEATIRADQAAIEASQVAISYGTIRATIGGRTGVINVFPARWSRRPLRRRWSRGADRADHGHVHAARAAAGRAARGAAAGPVP